MADAVRDEGRKLWGAVYEIADVDMGKLDKSEGYKPSREENSYWRRDCVVLLDGDNKRPLTVATYFGERQSNPPPPNQAYKDLILAGALHWHLPDEYIQELERIEVTG